MKLTMRSMRGWRMPTWLMLLLTVGAFAWGLVVGMHRGLQTGHENANMFSSYVFFTAYAGLKKGEIDFAERQFVLSIDLRVADHFAVQDAGWLEQLWRNGELIANLRSRPDGQLHGLKILAQQRLDLIPAIQPQTLAAWKALGRDADELRVRLGYFERATRLAPLYSQLLGRAVQPEELVADVFARELIQTTKSLQQTH